jgi:hypothetical protein
MPDSKHDLPKDFRPWALAIIASLLLIAGLIIRFAMTIDESTSVWFFNTFVKVAIVLFAMALAWNQIRLLQRSTYGKTVLVGMLITSAAFIVRPQLLKSVLPITLVGIVVFIAITFVRDLFKPNGK